MPRINGIGFFILMKDFIFESLFLDTQLWAEVIDHGIDKGVPQRYLEQIQSPRYRADLCRKIAYGKYVIEPPRTGYKAKEDGGERIYFANSPQDRLLLHAICKWLVRKESKMIHPSCLSYQEGIGIGRIVKDLSNRIVNLSGLDKETVVGRKFDIHKYFETVDRRSIHLAFDKVEKNFGHSCIIQLLRNYYDSDFYYDSRQKKLLTEYYGIKQGCAVSSWLANVILYDLDEEASQLSGLYLRYSDDIIYIGTDYQKATEIIRKHLNRLGLTLNDKKQEDITSNKFVRFLGYNIRGKEITLSRKWVKNFQQQIDKITIKNTQLVREVRNLRKNASPQSEAKLQKILERVQKRICRYLYYGDGQHSWATHVLGVVNRKNDIHQMTLYCLDAIRAIYTDKTSIGGLGVSLQHGILRGKGRHVSSNRLATSSLENHGWFSLFLSPEAMYQAISNPWLYRTLVADILINKKVPLYQCNVKDSEKELISKIEKLEELFDNFYNSQPDGRQIDRFYARKLSEMNQIDLIYGENREIARKALEDYINENIDFDDIKRDEQSWFWQSQIHPEFVLLKKWFNV